MRRRKWTKGEEQRLFDDYFGTKTVICPVCLAEVSMIMTHLGPAVTLLLSCENCGNRARVTREFPLQGPLKRAAA